MYNKRGPNRLMYELKPEYKIIKDTAYGFSKRWRGGGGGTYL